MDKTKGRDTYIVTNITENVATCIKTKEKSKGVPYKVKLEDLFAIINPRNDESQGNCNDESTESEEDTYQAEASDPPMKETTCNALEEHDDTITETPKTNKRAKPRIDYKILNKTGNKVRLRKISKHCTFCFKSRYRNYNHSIKYCMKAAQARSIIKARTEKLAILSESSESEEEQHEANESLLKVGLINQIARTVIQRTRDIYTEGLQLNEFQPLE